MLNGPRACANSLQGFTQRKSRSKFLWRSLRRLEALGCLRVVYVENSDPTSEVRKWLKCAQFMKSPSAEDRLAYLTAKKSSKSIPKLKHDFDVDAKDDGQDSDALEADDDVIPQESVDSEKPPKIQPHWNPHTLFVNTISDLVKEAGRAGISSMVSANETFS